MPDDTLMVCAVCGRVLDEVTTTIGITAYVHAMQDRLGSEDHPAVPVSAAEMAYVGRCDFCNLDHPRWVIPVRTFEMPGFPGNFSKGDWAACNACCGLIRNGHWESLVRRAANHSSLRTILPAYETRNILRKLYTTVRRNRNGEPYQIPS